MSLDGNGGMTSPALRELVLSADAPRRISLKIF
jgi:hypothetical protein